MLLETIVKKKPFKICPMEYNADNEKLFKALREDVAALDKLDTKLKGLLINEAYPYGAVYDNEYYHIWYDNKLIGYFGIKKDRGVNYITVTESYSYPEYVTTTFMKLVLDFLNQMLEEEQFDFMTFDVVKGHKFDTILTKLKVTSFSKSYIQFKSIKI